MKTKRENYVISIILLIICTAVWLYIQQIPKLSAIYPMFVIATLAVFSVILFLQTFFQKDSGAVSKLPDKEGLKSIGAFLLITLVYAAFISVLGWIVSSSVYLCIYMKKTMGINIKAFVIGIVSIIAFRFLLSSFMYIHMPRGILGLW